MTTTYIYIIVWVSFFGPLFSRVTDDRHEACESVAIADKTSGGNYLAFKVSVAEGHEAPIVTLLYCGEPATEEDKREEK